MPQPSRAERPAVAGSETRDALPLPVGQPVAASPRVSSNRALETLATDLRSLRLSCGSPSYATLRRGSALLPPATISDALSARVVPRLEFVVAFVQGCLHYADARGITVDPALADLDQWRQRWLQVRRQANARRTGLPAATAVRRGRRQAPAVADSGGSDGGDSGAPTTRVPSGSGNTDGRADADGSGDAIGVPVGRNSPPWQLPNAIRRLFGRDPELARLDAMMVLSSPADVEEFSDVAPVVVLHGMGGVGKTALALWWGHRHRASFPDGQLYVDLNGYGPGVPAEPAHVLTLFVRALGASAGTIPGDVVGLSALFRTLCTDRKLLVVLDNAADAEQVLPLLPASSGTAAIITSREAMGGLSVRVDAERIAVDPLSDAQSVALLTRDLPQFDQGRLRRLASLCGNLPLALRLAASRLTDDPLDFDLAALIDRASGGARGGVGATRDLLGALADPDDPYCDLATVLSWSLSAGSAAESRAMLLLSQSPTSTLDDHLASALVGLPLSPTRQLLAGLAARHLVERRPSGGWRIHDLVHAWAADGARRELGERQCREVRRRALGYFVWTADAMDRMVLPQRGRPSLTVTLPAPLALPRWGSDADALAWGDSALPALSAVLADARHLAEFQAAAVLPHVMMSYLNLRKPWAQWISMCRAALDAAARLDDHELAANLHIAAGIAHRETQSLSEAIDQFSAALDAFRRVGNRTGAAMTLNNLATVYQQAGEPTRARDALLRARDELIESEDDYRIAIVLHNLAESELELGEYSDAIDHAGRALDAALATGDALGAATTRTTLGRIRWLLGDVDLAESEFVQSAQVQSAGGDPFGQATTRRHLGDMLLQQGRAAEAVTQLAEAERILAELGDPGAREVAALHRTARAAADADAVVGSAATSSERQP